MAEVPSAALRHPTVPAGACSLRSNQNQPQPAGAGFYQTPDEFFLDTLRGRDRAAVFQAIGEVDINKIEPETAIFLRGFVLGEFKFFGDDK